MAELPPGGPWYGVEFVGHIDFSVGAEFGMRMSPGFGEAHPEWTVPGQTFTVEDPCGGKWQAELLDRPVLVDGVALLRLRFNRQYETGSAGSDRSGSATASAAARA